MNKKEKLITVLLCALVAPFALTVGVAYMGLLAMKIPLLVWLSAIGLSTWISKPIARRIENRIAKDEIDEIDEGYSTVDDLFEMMEKDCFEYQEPISTPNVTIENEPSPTFDFSLDVSKLNVPMEDGLFMNSAWQDDGKDEYSDSFMIYANNNDVQKSDLNMEDELLMSSVWGQSLDDSKSVVEGHKQYTR